MAESLPAFHRITAPTLRTPAEGADTAIWLATTTPAPPTGRFWHDRRPRPQHYLPFTREGDDDRQKLWEYCVGATGIDPAR